MGASTKNNSREHTIGMLLRGIPMLVTRLLGLGLLDLFDELELPA